MCRLPSTTVIVTALSTFAVAALLVNIMDRKDEERDRFVQLVELTEDDTDPEKWGAIGLANTSRISAQPWQRVRDSGHGGSDALPEEKIERQTKPLGAIASTECESRLSDMSPLSTKRNFSHG